MPDLEKAIKGLEACRKTDCINCPYSALEKEACLMNDMFTDAIAILKGQEWIPVTERLPEVRHAVLCYTPHHKNIWALSLHEDNEWYYWIPLYEKYNPDFDGDITHWMPLPEPPKESR